MKFFNRLKHLDHLHIESCGFTGAGNFSSLLSALEQFLICCSAAGGTLERVVGLYVDRVDFSYLSGENLSCVQGLDVLLVEMCVE